MIGFGRLNFFTKEKDSCVEQEELEKDEEEEGDRGFGWTSPDIRRRTLGQVENIVIAPVTDQ